MKTQSNRRREETHDMGAEGANPFPAGADETLRQKDSALNHFWKVPATGTDGANAELCEA